MKGFNSKLYLFSTGNTIDCADLGSAHSTVLSEYDNTFLQETDRISEIDSAIRYDIEKKYRKSKTNSSYVFPRK
jgi:hypothetical protein